MCFSQYNSKAILQKMNANFFVLSSLYHKICLWSCVNIFFIYFLFKKRKRIREILLRLSDFFYETNYSYKFLLELFVLCKNYIVIELLPPIQYNFFFNLSK